MSPLVRFSFWWCRHMHGRPLHPICGAYICPRCFRAHKVPWAGPRIVARPPVAREETGVEKVWRERDEVAELERLLER